MTKYLYHNTPLPLNVVTMNRFRVLIGFLAAVSLVTVTAPLAEGSPVPGERILFAEESAAGGPFHAVVMGSDGSGEYQLVEGITGQMSPDGEWVFYFPQLGNSLWRVPVDGGGPPVKVIDSPGQDTRISWPRWSPDSQRIVFELQTDGEDEHDPPFSDVWVVNIDGSGLVNLTHTPVANESGPMWFPDGRRILFTYLPDPSAAPGGIELAVTDIDAGGGYEVITDEPDLYFSTYRAGFIDDARRVIVNAYAVLDPDPDNLDLGPGDLWLVDLVAGESSLLLGANTDKSLAVMDVSADASMILYAAFADTATVWLADSNGGNRAKVYKKAGMGVWDAQFNSDDTSVLLNPHDGSNTGYVVVKDLAAGDSSTLRSGEMLGTKAWIPPGVMCDGLVATIVGTDGADTLVGTSGVDVIVGFGGDDVIDGGGGDDVVCAGYGNDVVRGEAGDDILLGGPGQDELRGGAGKDSVLGDSGNDSLYGGKGKDLVRGGGGADWIHGQWKRDRLYGELGKDIIYGGDGDDTISGGNADDHLYGGAGNDDAAGNRGDDVLYGGPGDDVLTGGLDVDVVYGNTGVDTCTAETIHGC